LVYTAAFSQDVKPRFRSLNVAGAAIGVSQPKLLFQSVNGVKYQEWFAGIGIGLDEYEIKSLPLFLDIRMDFGEKKKGFIYGDIGYNFFLEDKLENFIYPGMKTTWKGGIYSDVGVGLRTVFIKKVNMIFSLGHSYKNMKKTEVTKICLMVPPCYEDISRERYNYGRLNLKVGWEL
jgi:hypothetical protein